MSDIITFFINKFDGGVGRIKISFNLFIMSLSHGVSSFDDKDKIFEGSANTLKHRYKYERLHIYIHYTHLNYKALRTMHLFGTGTPCIHYI